MVSKKFLEDQIICIVGLGYVGLPLAKEFSKYFKVIAFDINQTKVRKLKKEKSKIIFTTNPKDISKADFVIIAVPTPIKKNKEPDLSYLISATEIIGDNLKRGAIVVSESTVYPGLTEEIIGPILEKKSGLKLGEDFKIGYSPERVNPGDKYHTVDKIIKIVSGIDDESTEKLALLYGRITKIYKTSDIQTAEAAKVIENIQRDINIALINELSLIFQRMNIDTKSVLDAAETKWNFYRFEPGLVGGHCIPVDPYYLVYKSKELGYHPQVILSGRSINDYMSKHVALMAIKSLNHFGKVIKGSKILIMGLTFKENVDDIRETPVRDMIKELQDFQCFIYGYDPLLDNKAIKSFNIKPMNTLNEKIKIDCVIITVVHDIFYSIDFDILKKMMGDKPILIDVRGAFLEKARNYGIFYKRL